MKAEDKLKAFKDIIHTYNYIKKTDKNLSKDMLETCNSIYERHKYILEKDSKELDYKDLLNLDIAYEESETIKLLIKLSM